LTRRCLIGTASRYLAADRVPVSKMAQRRHLRSAASHRLIVPSYRLNSSDFRAFSVGYSVRNCGTLCLDCWVTLATTVLDILWRHFFSHSTGA